MKKTSYKILFSGLLSLLLLSVLPGVSSANDALSVTKISPLDEATVSLVVTLKWQTVNGANAYNIIIADRNINTYLWDKAVADEEGATQSITLPSGTLEGGTKYNWCVRGLKISSGSELTEGRTYDYKTEVLSKNIIDEEAPDCSDNATFAKIDSGAWDDFYTETVGKAELPAPTKLKPSGLSIFPLTFSWAEVKGAQAYWWQISGQREKTDNSGMEAVPGLPSGTVDASKALEVTIDPFIKFSGELVFNTDYSYTFKIKSCLDANCNSTSKTSSQVEFTVALKKPKLVSPGNGEWLDSTTALLEWTESVGAERYRLDMTGLDTYINRDNCSDEECSFEAAGLDPGSSYNWQIIAERGGETPLPSGSSSFQIRANAGPPEEGVEPGALSGSIEVSDTSVIPNESFTITITGESDETVEQLTVAFYAQGDPSPIAYLWCKNTSTCTKTRTLSQSEEGKYTYYGRIIAEGKTNFKTKSVTITVKSKTSGSSGGSGGGGGFFGSGGEGCPEGQIICNPLAYDTFEELVHAITVFIFNIALVLAPIMFVISGFLYVTSAGNPGRIATAQRIALYTAIGFAVIMLASGLVNVMRSLLSGS